MYRFYPFILDPINQCLLRHTAGDYIRIHVPPKAFSVLTVLVEKAGQLVGHDELMERVWPATFVQPEVLSSHIRDLRSALEDSAKSPQFIETISRRGYRFIASIERTETRASAPHLNSSTQHLVGRDQELSQLHRAYRATQSGMRKLVFVTGEPGMGKTSLCREFLQQVRDSDSMRSAWGQCIEGYGTQEPYSPMLKAIGELCRTCGQEVLETFKKKAPTCVVQFSDLLGSEERATLGPEVRFATSGRVLRELLDALETIAESRPLILVLDDLQWVDHASVDVISEFARRHTPTKILIVGAFRPLEAFLNANPITVLKEELLAHRLCIELSISGLTRDDVDVYLSSLITHTELRSDLASLLYRRSEGNPLFMVAALEHSLEQGLLVNEEGGLQLRGALDQLEVDIPRSLKRVLEAQIDNLRTEERRTLEAASVEGIIFSPEVIANAVDHTPQEVDDICHNLAFRNLILHVVPGEQFGTGRAVPKYQFVHVLYRDVLYDRQSPGRRAGRHQTIGTRLEELHSDHLEEVAAELALHFEHASDWDRAVRYLRLAADNSERRYAHREALALLTRAHGFVERTAQGTRSAVELGLLERVATIYLACFDSRCVEAYERLFERATALGHVEVAAKALLNSASCLLLHDSRSCLQKAVRAMTAIAAIPDPLTRSRLEVSCNFIIICSQRWDQSQINELRDSYTKVMSQMDPSALVSQTIQYDVLQWASPDYDRSLECFRECLEVISKRAGSHDSNVAMDHQRAHFYLSRAFLFEGKWGRAWDVLDGSLSAAEKSGDPFALRTLRLNRAWLLFHGMDFNAVLAASSSIEEADGNFEGAYLTRFSTLLCGAAHLALGDGKVGLPIMRRMSEEMEEHPIVFDWCFRLPLLQSLAEYWLSVADFVEARKTAKQALDLAFTTKKYTYQACALDICARIALAEADPVSAAQFIERAGKITEKFNLPLASWRVHGTAALVHAHNRQRSLELQSRKLARQGIFALADSMTREHPLRKAFLSSTPVADLLGQDYRLDSEEAIEVS